jgi:hypothetical protein
MRFLPTAALVFTLAAPAVAEPQNAPAVNADTYKEVVAHGVVIVTPDIEIDVIFTPDGKFAAMGGLSKGVWHIDGDKMCSTPSETLIESCAVYPAGKKSGDTFEIQAPTGSVTIRIK